MVRTRSSKRKAAPLNDATGTAGCTEARPCASSPTPTPPPMAAAAAADAPPTTDLSGIFPSKKIKNQLCREEKKLPRLRTDALELITTASAMFVQKIVAASSTPLDDAGPRTVTLERIQQTVQTDAFLAKFFQQRLKDVARTRDTGKLYRPPKPKTKAAAKGGGGTVNSNDSNNSDRSTLSQQPHKGKQKRELTGMQNQLKSAVGETAANDLLASNGNSDGNAEGTHWNQDEIVEDEDDYDSDSD